MPAPGSAWSTRQRKSWASSSSVGRLNDFSRQAVGAQQPERVVDHAALAGGVHALQHDENPPTATGVGLRVHPLLQLGEVGPDVRAGPSPPALGAVEPRGVSRVVVGERDRTLGQPEQVGDGVSHGPSMSYGLPVKPGYGRHVDLPVMPPVQPMLAKSVKGIPDPAKFDEGLSFEPKFDGFRCHSLQGRRRGGADLAQHQAADPLLPRGGRGDPGAAAGALRSRR